MAEGGTKPGQVLSTIKSYSLESEGVPANVAIVRTAADFVPRYILSIPKLGEGTRAIMEEVEARLMSAVEIKLEEAIDSVSVERIKANFREKAQILLRKELPGLVEREVKVLSGLLIHQMLGLGNIEFLLRDDGLEEIVVNHSGEPIWVFYKQIGWLKTNVILSTEQQIENYSELIGRRVGRQITVLAPLMDAHLTTGDRVNATLFPISSKGNTITIRKFRRRPWTITDLVENNSVTYEAASLLWLAMQYELSFIVSGGTGSGKTTALNMFLSFIQPNHRVISIEDTRELNLPDFLHWVPLTTREPNQEGKGEVTMLDLMVNSLRMRPDRIILGEIRRQREAEVLFEAMMTGHSVYSTLHADTAEQTVRRIISPPISIAPSMLSSLDLIIVMFRDRRRGIRRTFEIAEILPEQESGGKEGGGSSKARILYRWKPRTDTIEPVDKSIVLFDKLSMHTGLSLREIDENLLEKQEVLKWICANKVIDVNPIGHLISEYYINHDELVKFVKSGKPAADFLSGMEGASK
ncbi:MAG: ATPase, T2SS/T4P/T4SS family [archaeon]